MTRPQGDPQPCPRPARILARRRRVPTVPCPPAYPLTLHFPDARPRPLPLPAHHPPCETRKGAGAVCAGMTCGFSGFDSLDCVEDSSFSMRVSIMSNSASSPCDDARCERQVLYSILKYTTPVQVAAPALGEKGGRAATSPAGAAADGAGGEPLLAACALHIVCSVTRPRAERGAGNNLGRLRTRCAVAGKSGVVSSGWMSRPSRGSHWPAR